MEQQAFIVSTSVVALAEMGDKTQLLSLILAARYRKPMPIVLGILVATLLNHAIAGALGAWLSSLMRPEVLNWVMAAAFIAMGLWILVPDKLDEDDVAVPKQQMVCFLPQWSHFFWRRWAIKHNLQPSPWRRNTRTYCPWFWVRPWA